MAREVVYRPLPYARTGSTLAQLLLRQGEQQADAERRRGDISANMWSTLGQQIGGAFTNYAEEKRDAPLRAMQRELLEGQVAGVRADGAAREVKSRQDEALQDLFSSGQMPSARDLMSRVGPERGAQIWQGLEALNSAQRKSFTDAQTVKRDLLMGLSALPEAMRAQAWGGVRQTAIDAGVIRPEDAPEAYDPDWFTMAVNYGRQPDQERNPNREALALRAAQGDPQAEQALRLLNEQDAPDLSRSSLDVQAAAALRAGNMEEYQRLMRAKREVGDAGRSPQSFIISQQGRDDAEGIAQRIVDGLDPPTISARVEGPVRAAIARIAPDFDLARARTDYQGITRHISSLNGPSQLRLRQTAYSALNSLDYLEQVLEDYKQKGGGVQLKTWNQFQNWAAEQGLTSPEYTEAFRMLNALVTDQESEVATVYRGGNSPTDATLLRAAQNLNTNWSAESMKKMIGLNRRQLQLRLQAIEQATAIGASGETNMYDPRRNNEGGTVRMQAPNGAIQDVPADQVEHFKSLGAKVVP